jgi:hypothetical protein
MSTELKIQFSDGLPNANDLEIIRTKIRSLPTFVREERNDEYWLCSPHTNSTWGYDIRIIFSPTVIWIDLLASDTECYSRDLKHLIDFCNLMQPAHLEDDDGEYVEL